MMRATHLVCLCLLLSGTAAAENKLPNASFRQGEDAPSGWAACAWRGKDQVEWLRAEPGRDDRHSVSIRSVHGADAAWTSTVAVQPHTRYELSGWIKTRDIRGAKGALFNIQGLQPAQTKAVRGSTDWTQVSIAFNTGNRETVEVNCLFGGWGSSTGQAWYDDVALRILQPAVARPKTIPGTLRGRDGLMAVPIMARESMPKPILGVGVSADGTVYVTETIRQMREDISLIQSPYLQQTDMALSSTQAKKRWILENYAKRSIAGRQGVRDFNGDGAVDEKDLSVRSEKIYRLQDSDADGVFDKARLFADGFTDVLTGVAHSVSPIDGHVYAAILPDLWKLTDTDGDGVADRRESIAHGFAPHIGYGNHDLHSIVQGYDGKLYWSMGDRGVNVLRKDGRRVSQPHSGTILRSNTDGSDFEIFAYGLRNCQYFDFDDYGNIFAVDHDADFQGERERLVYLPEGSDSGWRMYYQYRKSTGLVRAARDNLYNPWLAEKMWLPFHAGQPSHILPPIENSWNAPAAFSYQPGTALGGKYAGHFLLGGKGDIRAFKMLPDGASFIRQGDDVLIHGFTGQVLTSTFGPNGRLYFTLWKPRPIHAALWTLQAPSTPAMARVERLLSKGLKSHTVEQLLGLLGDSDRRVRQQAQFELVRRRETAALRQLAMARDAAQFPRLHSLWGLGQLAATDAELMATFCADPDAELRAQVARWAGEQGFDPDGRILALLRDASPRVQMMAAIACGKLKSPQAVAPLAEMLVAANNESPALRHAGSFGLAGAANSAQLVAFANHPSEALRIAAVIALRRQGALPELTAFLNDVSRQVRSDAACALYDEASPATVARYPQALAALAGMLGVEQPGPVNVRALAANRRLGTAPAATRISTFLDTPELDAALQIEALYTLDSWPESTTLDLVDGRHFPVSAGDPGALRTAIGPGIWALANSANPTVSRRAVALLRRIAPSDAERQKVAAIVADSARPDSLRIEWLRWLRDQDLDLFTAAGTQLLASDSPELRATAAQELAAAKRASEALEDYLLTALKASDDAGELQRAIKMIPRLRSQQSIRERLVGELIAGSIAPEVQLEVIEIASATTSTEFAAYQAAQAKAEPMTRYAASLHGGNARQGARVFRDAQAQCSKCHALKQSDKQVGPSLEGIGARESREYLLQSIVDPQAKITPGYGVVSLTLKDGRSIGGTVMHEDASLITVREPDGSTDTIAKAEIASQTAPIGMMPDLSAVLTARQIRDLVAYLASLR